ncbi:phage tail terminator protein [Aquitalea pelogenes]|uniref:phage tail terminator protein n=1 Tax=Aquitalea pelogenes TaxID=1293573 RepID=UPI000789753D|nr:hypothetical protein [Aquitalea pelogenes]
MRLDRPDHLALGKHIVVQLKAEISDVRQIVQRGELTDVTSGEQVSPSLYVIYVRDVLPGDGQSQEAQNHILQQWMVVAALQGSADQMLAKAGELLAKVRAALLGWTPDVGLYDPLQASTPPAALYISDWGYFPLLFTADFYA